MIVADQQAAIAQENIIADPSQYFCRQNLQQKFGEKLQQAL
ncbi:hypothetical protein [Sphaerotilus montanus]